jgi:hypothetical protein
MLLSLSHKFVFVANLKSASSAIETAIGIHAEIRLVQTRFGKHDGLSAISQRFAWVQRYVPFDEFFVFGVMRDPVDYLLSLYNSHQKPYFDGKRPSTKGLSFDVFLEEWCQRSWQARPQFQRFTDEHCRFRMDHVISLDRLGDEFPGVCKHIGIDAVQLGHVNTSPAVLSRAELTPAQIEKIQERYKDDYELIRNRPKRF